MEEAMVVLEYTYKHNMKIKILLSIYVRKTKQVQLP